jgi:hypothetical protein
MDLVNVIDHPINQIIKLSFIILTLNKVSKTKNLENIDYIPTTVTCLSYIHFQMGKGQNYENQNVENQKEHRKPCKPSQR